MKKIKRIIAVMVLMSLIKAFPVNVFASVIASIAPVHKVIGCSNIIEVISGDTLGELTHEYKSKDVCYDQYLYEFKKINNLRSSIIYPGDVLKLPLFD